MHEKLHHVTEPLIYIVTVMFVFISRCQTKRGQMSRLGLSYFLVLVVIIGNPVLLWLTYKKSKLIVKFNGLLMHAA